MEIPKFIDDLWRDCSPNYLYQYLYGNEQAYSRDWISQKSFENYKKDLIINDIKNNWICDEWQLMLEEFHIIIQIIQHYG